MSEFAATDYLIRKIKLIVNRSCCNICFGKYYLYNCWFEVIDGFYKVRNKKSLINFTVNERLVISKQSEVLNRRIDRIRKARVGIPVLIINFGCGKCQSVKSHVLAFSDLIKRY